MSTEEMIRRAQDSYERDRRFRALVDSVVAAAIHDHGPIDPARADRDARYIALSATANLLQRIYEEDAELHRLRIERDHYEAIARAALARSPSPPLVIETRPKS